VDAEDKLNTHILHIGAFLASRGGAGDASAGLEKGGAMFALHVGVHLVVDAENSHVQRRPPDSVLEVAVGPEDERIWDTSDSQGV